MSKTKDELVYDILGSDSEGWTSGTISSFSDRAYGVDRGPGVCFDREHGEFKATVVYPVTALCYEDAQVGDKVKARTQRIVVEGDCPDYCVASIKVTSVSEGRVEGTYLTSQYDRMYLGEKLEQEWVGRKTSWTLDVVPESVITEGQVLYTALKSEIKLIERASNDGHDTDSSSV